jgi:hypothetical protein
MSFVDREEAAVAQGFGTRVGNIVREGKRLSEMLERDRPVTKKRPIAWDMITTLDIHIRSEYFLCTAEGRGL